MSKMLPHCHICGAKLDQVGERTPSVPEHLREAGNCILLDLDARLDAHLQGLLAVWTRRVVPAHFTH